MRARFQNILSIFFIVVLERTEEFLMRTRGREKEEERKENIGAKISNDSFFSHSLTKQSNIFYLD